MMYITGHNSSLTPTEGKEDMKIADGGESQEGFNIENHSST